MIADREDLELLPEGVRDVVSALRGMAAQQHFGQPSNEAADLIERLARENAELQSDRDLCLAMRDKYMAELAALRQKIAEARRKMILNRGKPEYSVEGDAQREIIDMCLALLPLDDGGEG